MPISVTCSECETTYRVSDDAAGKAIKCKKCGARIAVPAGGGDDEDKPAKTRAGSTADAGEEGGGEPRPKKKGGSSKVIIIIAAIAVVFCCLCVPGGGGFGVYWFVIKPVKEAAAKDFKDVFKDAFKDAFKDVAKDMPKKGGGPAPTGPTLLERKETLTQKDPLNHAQKPAKTYKVKLEAGKEYVIDMKAVNKFDGSDPYLFLLDPQGKEVAKDDDSGGFPDAQIRYRPTMSGEFTVQASCFGGIPPPGLAFHLTVKQQ
jgi:predicted Zn finger-like uncharacterized protein